MCVCVCVAYSLRRHKHPSSSARLKPILQAVGSWFIRETAIAKVGGSQLLIEPILPKLVIRVDDFSRLLPISLQLQLQQ